MLQFAIKPRWAIDYATHERFGLPADQYLEFAHAYGFDVRDSAAYPVLRRMREVLITTWLLGPAGADPRASAELDKRIAGLRESGQTAPWEPL